MAGCYSIVSDSLDEFTLPIHYVTKLCNEIVGNPDKLPHWSNREEYIYELKNIIKEDKVYDIYYRSFQPKININKLDRYIWHEQKKIQIKQLKNKVYSIYKQNIYIIYFVCVVVLWYVISLCI